MDDLHGSEEDLAAYSLGALPDDEARRVEAHLAACPACRLQAEEFRAVADLLPYSVPLLDPPPALERRVLAAATPPARRPWRLPAWSAAAAAAVLVLAAFSAGHWMGRTWHRPGPVAVTRMESVRLVGTGMAPGASAQLVVMHTDSGMQKYVLEADGLPPLQGDAVYTMWMTHDGQRENCGSFKVDARGHGMLAYDSWRGQRFDQVGITLEPEFNATNQPRGSKVLGLSV